MRMTTGTVLNKFLDMRVSGMKLCLFDPKMISAHFLWGNVFLRGELYRDVKNSNLWTFENALHLKCGGLPLSRSRPIAMKLLCVCFIWYNTSSMQHKNLKGLSVVAEFDRNRQKPSGIKIDTYTCQLQHVPLFALSKKITYIWPGLQNPWEYRSATPRKKKLWMA